MNIYQTKTIIEGKVNAIYYKCSDFTIQIAYPTKGDGYFNAVKDFCKEFNRQSINAQLNKGL